MSMKRVESKSNSNLKGAHAPQVLQLERSSSRVLLWKLNSVACHVREGGVCDSITMMLYLRI